MPTDDDPDWRPDTYWPPLPSTDDLVSRVRGAHRRDTLRAALATGDLSGIDPDLLVEVLSREERQALMRLHPHLTLGEYLPDLEDQDLPEGEVEIARLYLASGIGNTISIRACRVDATIRYRAVDEFEETLSVTPAETTEPLTNAELLQAVKTLQWEGPFGVWEVREIEAEAVDLETAAEFITGESDIYPSFAALIETDNGEWLEEHLNDGQDDDEL